MSTVSSSEHAVAAALLVWTLAACSPAKHAATAEKATASLPLWDGAGLYEVAGQRLAFAGPILRGPAADGSGGSVSKRYLTDLDCGIALLQGH